MIRILSFVIACAGFATCIASTLVFMPLLATTAIPLETVDRMTSEGMMLGLVLSALGGLGLLATEVASELRAA